jgi:Phospholipase_D-nuclease N-terminal
MHGSILVSAAIIAMIIWLIVFIVCLLSVSRRRDISLPEKIFWGAIIFFAPVLGLIFYLVFGFKKMRTTKK